MGYFRFLLALMVAADHLTPLNWVGRWAVIGFYFLSGYTITASIQGKYKNQFMRFWVTRFWRLYPIYFVCWVLAAIATFQGYGFGAMGWGEPWSITMLSFQQPTPIPPAWTFTNMLIGYLAISLGISRSQNITFVWVLASATAYMIGDISISEPDDYHSFTFASLPFSLGAFWYWQGWKLPREKGKIDRWASAVSYPVFLSHWMIGAVISYWTGLGQGISLFLYSLLPTLAFSWALVQLDSKLFRRNHA